jgi:hypothetical protein
MRPFLVQAVVRGRPKARRRRLLSLSGSPGTTCRPFRLCLLVLAAWYVQTGGLKALPALADGFSAVYFQPAGLQDAQALNGAPVSGNPKTDIVPQVNFSSALRPWAPVANPNLFSARFTGKFIAPASGAYGFSVNADNGVRLWVDEQLIIDTWQPQPAKTRTGLISLAAGELYSLRLEYYHQSGASVCSLGWRLPNGTQQLIPTGAVYSGVRLYPAGAFGPHFRNIRDYGAAGDGKTDDTAAIQKAIGDCVGNGSYIYFPNGTYLVSRQLAWTYADASGDVAWSCFLGFQGESQGNTVIRLAPGSAAFQDAAAPLAVIQTGDLGGTPAGVNAYLNNLRDFTVEVSAGNPGACGLYFHGTNTSSLRRLTVRDLGNQTATGVTADFCAGVVQELTVKGFAYGVIPTQGSSSCQFYERLTLIGQQCFGLDLTDFANITVRHLRSENAVPGIFQTLGFTPASNTAKRNRGGALVVLDSLFQGLGATGAGIAIDDAAALVRNTSAPGAQNFISQEGTAVGGSGVDEYVTYPAYSLFTATARSLDLAVAEVPEFHDNNPANWVNVADFGAVADGNTDSSAALQAAIDYAAAAGKTTLYLPPGRSNLRGDYVSKSYVCQQGLKVHGGSLRVIAGLGSQVRPRPGPGASGFPGALVHLQNAANLLEVDDLTVGTDSVVSGLVAFSQESPRPVLLRDTHAVNVTQWYVGTAGAGDLYADCSAATGWYLLAGQHAWMRSVNPESSQLAALNNGAQIRNAGASLWVAGIKTETTATIVLTEQPGATEVLGLQAFNIYHPGDPLAANGKAAFSVNGGQFSATGETVVVGYVEQAAADNHLPNPHFSSLVCETQNGVSRTLGTDTLPASVSAGGGRFCLYTDSRATNVPPAASFYKRMAGDTFESQAIGPHWQTSGGTWSVARRINPFDTAIPDAPDTVWSYCLQQSAPTGSANARLNQAAASDCLVECSIGRDPSTPGATLGIMGRASDVNNGYRLSFYQDQSGQRHWSLDRYVAGQKTTLSAGLWPFPQPDYVWYTLAVAQLEFKGNTIAARVRSSESAEFTALGTPVTDATFASGTVVLYDENGRGCFDNVYTFWR